MLKTARLLSTLAKEHEKVKGKVKRALLQSGTLVSRHKGSTFTHPCCL